MAEHRRWQSRNPMSIAAAILFMVTQIKVDKPRLPVPLLRLRLTCFVTLFVCFMPISDKYHT